MMNGLKKVVTTAEAHTPHEKRKDDRFGCLSPYIPAPPQENPLPERKQKTGLLQRRGGTARDGYGSQMERPRKPTQERKWIRNDRKNYEIHKRRAASLSFSASQRLCGRIWAHPTAQPSGFRFRSQLFPFSLDPFAFRISPSPHGAASCLSRK